MHLVYNQEGAKLSIGRHEIDKFNEKVVSTWGASVTLSLGCVSVVLCTQKNFSYSDDLKDMILSLETILRGPWQRMRAKYERENAKNLGFDEIDGESIAFSFR